MVISDFARKTPLSMDQIKILEETIARDCLTDNFVAEYLSTLRLKKKDKKKLVKKYPSFVERAFHLFGDRELGELFVEEYAGSEDRHHTAYFISLDLGKPIDRRKVNRLFDAPGVYFSNKEIHDAQVTDHQRYSAILYANSCRRFN